MKGNLDNSSIVASNSDSYVGDGNVDMAIAHGLGRIPNGILIFVAAGNATFGIISSNAGIHHFEGGAYWAVTTPDDTNFYVGNVGSMGGSANNLGTTYYWVAW